MTPPERLFLLASTLAPAAALQAQPLDCMIQPHQVVQVGTPVPGLIQQVLAERGDSVRRGQVVVRLNDAVERAALDLARERAAQTGEAQSAGGARELAQRELQRAHELHQERFVSQTYVDKALAEATVAQGRSQQAQERRRLAERELELAAAQWQQRTVRAPIDGVVVDRLVAPGEYVENRPLLRIASIDPLRVDALVPAAHFGRIKAGQQATVTPELVSPTTHTATVTTVDRVIDAASNTFRVRLSLPNPGHALPAGLRCKVDLGLGAPPGAAAAAPGQPVPVPAQGVRPAAATLPR